MSVQAISWVFAKSETSGTARLVMLSIANHIGPEGEGWVYVDQILLEANCSDESYRRACAKAAALGELERQVNEGGTRRARSGRRPNLFRFPAMIAAGDSDSAVTPPRSADPTPPQTADPRGPRSADPLPLNVDSTPPRSADPTPPQIADPTPPQTADPLEGAVSGAVLEPSVAPAPPTPATTRRRDEIFDAVTDVCGIDVASLTPAGRGPLNAAVKQLRDVAADPDEIHARARRFAERYRGLTLTPPALAKHWAQLAGRPGAGARPSEPRGFGAIRSVLEHGQPERVGR